MNRKFFAFWIFYVLVGLHLWRGNVQPVKYGPAKVASPSLRSSLKQPAVATNASVAGAAAVPDFTEWLQDWRAGSGTIDDGKAAALARRERLARLMVENPRQAWAESLSWADWRSLPEEIRALVERPFSERVDYSVRPICKPLDPALPAIHPHRVLLNSEWRDAYIFGRRTEMKSKEGLPARGFELDGKVVLAEDGIERVSAEDLAAVEELFPSETAGRSWVSAQPLNSAARRLLIGGRIYDVASDVEASQVARLLTAVEESLHPKAMAIALAAGAGAGTIYFNVAAAERETFLAKSTWTETIKRTVALRISYASAPFTYSYTATELQNLMTGVSNTVKVMSYGKTALQVTVVTMTLPNSWQYYQDNGPDAIASDARARLIAMGMNRNNYDFATHFHPGHNFGYAGLGQIGAGDAWLNGNQSLEVTTHEIGHNYGLGHAHFLNSQTGNGNFGHNNPDGSFAEREEYGDIYDIMGGSTLPAGQFGAYGKAALNWIEPREVINVVTNGIYRVHRFDHRDARTNTANRLALKIATPGGDEYWVSHRRLFTGNLNLFRGAYVLRADGSADQSLIDTTPISRVGGYGSDRDDAGLAIGKSFIDPLRSVQITTLYSGGTSPQEFIDVQVTFLDGAGYELFTDNTLAIRGLTGSYVNRSLRAVNQTDWRVSQAISGRRTDRTLAFRSNGWGTRAPVGITGGSDADWENFSVQWDGILVVNRASRLATISDDGSRFWIDVDRDGVFAAAELVNNGWGNGQGATRGLLSPVIRPGSYPIRIQYEEGNGGNVFSLIGTETPFELFTTQAATTRGLTGSFVARSLRTTLSHTDWRSTQTITGTRVDEFPIFTRNGWGALASAGLTAANGTDDNWENFSAQWDGWLSNSVPLRFVTASDDHSRIWIDVNGDANFGTQPPEYINNNWGGGGQGMTIGTVSLAIQPGLRRVRIQYEEGGGDNGLMLMAVPPVSVDASVLVGLTTFTGLENRSISRRGTGDFTIQFWMRSSQVTGGENEWTEGAGLVDASVDGPARDFGAALGNGRVLFGVGGASPVTIRSHFVADDQWHHVSARRQRETGELTLFIDGQAVAEGLGGTELLDEATAMRAGSLANSTQFFIGQLDQVKIWETARADHEVLADYHLSRTGHGFDVNAAPAVQIAQLRPGAVQVFWDALSGYRVLQGAVAATGPWANMPTDQNSTNVPFGNHPRRFFRVLRP